MIDLAFRDQHVDALGENLGVQSIEGLRARNAQRGHRDRRVKVSRRSSAVVCLRRGNCRTNPAPSARTPAAKASAWLASTRRRPRRQYKT
jgi:hypothetical protein